MSRRTRLDDDVALGMCSSAMSQGRAQAGALARADGLEQDSDGGTRWRWREASWKDGSIDEDESCDSRDCEREESAGSGEVAGRQ